LNPILMFVLNYFTSYPCHCECVPDKFARPVAAAASSSMTVKRREFHT
jgi:hypothetical protein